VTARAGHRQIDHTADLALEIWAPTEAELLAEGARALVGILTDGAALAARDARDIRLEALDREDRLVRWLNEVLVLAVPGGFLAAEARLELTGETGLRAALRGEAGAAKRVVTELKAATYHDLALTHDDRGWRARVVIDV
jgi:SHS2 domain-containing protein